MVTGWDSKKVTEEAGRSLKEGSFNMPLYQQRLNDPN